VKAYRAKNNTGRNACARSDVAQAFLPVLFLDKSGLT
jgi:hypothetical protein